MKSTKKLYFNKTCYFSDVSKDIWEFKIGGYQVLKQYLVGGRVEQKRFKYRE